MTSNDVFLGGGSSSGSYNKANLPNISGTFRSLMMEGVDISSLNLTGCFYDFVYYNFWWRGTSSASGKLYGNDYKFNLNSVNQIYNNSNRVNPNYYTIEFWIKFK